MYDNRIKEIDENLDEVENLLESTTIVIDKMSEEIADLKETNARLIREIESLASELSSSELIASAIREIQDEMKKAKQETDTNT